MLRSLDPVNVPDEFNGGRTATRELIRYGHTAVAFINNVDDIAAARGRLAGYRSALDEAGLGFRPEYVVRETSNAVGGLRAARRLLSQPNRPSAIFCFNDRVAMGVYQAAHERGLRIPGDVSVIGFDNQIAVGDGLFPGLTTIALPHYEMGAWGARTLIHQLEDPQEGAVEHVALACPLIARGSISEPTTLRKGLRPPVLTTNRTVRKGQDLSQVNFGAPAPAIQGHYRSRGGRAWSE